MDERKEFRAWCDAYPAQDWLIATSFEESFYLGAWAAWRHLRAALAAATERAEAAERASDRLRAFCDAIDNMIPDGISHEGADTDDRVRDLVWRYVNTIARADALAARLREVEDREHPA